jgi:hypothetical protein
VSEFEAGQLRLASETTRRNDLVALFAGVGRPAEAWFGSLQGPRKSPAKRAVCQQPLSQTGQVHHLVHAGLNAIPLLANFSGTWFLSAIGALAIYLPAIFFDNNESS